MEDFYYNVLWIDDEYEKLSSTKGRAKRNGINLNPFKSLEAGMSELEKNYTYYDGVLLDAKFFENEDDVAGSEDTYSSFRAKDRILQLPKKFEIFVLTGQAEAYKDKTFKKAFSKVYEKGKDEEINRLFEDIKEAAEGQVDTQIRFRYRRIFEVCTERYIGEHAGQDLLKLLKDVETASVDSDLNAIRKLVEDLFKAFHSNKLLPSDFVTPSVSLNESSRFLAGKGKEGPLVEKGYTHLDGTHLPNHIASHLRSILFITQSGSHRSDIDKYVKEIKSPYLFRSVLYQLMDVLVWFKMYVDSKPNTENWTKDDTSEKLLINLIEGKVADLHSAGYAFFVPNDGSVKVVIPQPLVLTYRLKNGDNIAAEVENYLQTSSGKTKTRVKRIEI